MKIRFAGSPRFLLEGVQNSDLLGQTRQIDHTELPSRLDSNLLHAPANQRHRFPIGRVEAMLQPVQLVTRFTPDGFRETANRGQRDAEEYNAFHVLYMYIYISVQPQVHRRSKGFSLFSGPIIGR